MSFHPCGPAEAEREGREMMWPFDYFKRSKVEQKHQDSKPLSRGEAAHAGAAMMTGAMGMGMPVMPPRRRYAQTPTPAPIVVQDNSSSGLVEGIIIGEILASNSNPPDPTPSNDFAGFGGGESGGAGAGGSYEAPSSDSSSSCDTSSSDSSSSSDCGSSDSGSSGSDS